jgi:hypothetical protein
MSAIPFTEGDLKKALIAQGAQGTGIWTVWNFAEGRDDVDGFGVIDGKLTFEIAQAVAAGLSAMPGSAWVSVERDIRVRPRPKGYDDCRFLFFFHTGPAHAKLAAIAAMQAEVPT